MFPADWPDPFGIGRNFDKRENKMKQFSCLAIGMAILLASSGLPAQAPVDAQALADRWTEAYNDHDVHPLAAPYT